MLEGGCLCGAVRYRVEGEPEGSGTCHCRTCRKAASAPNLPFATFRLEQLAFTRGAPAEFRSSPGVTRSFCGRCGSPLTYRSDEHPGTIDIMSGSLDNPDALPPTHHVWTSDKLAWESIADGLPVYPTTKAAGQ